VKLFMAAFPDQVRSEKDMRFFMAANAIAAFEIAAFSSLNSPYDKFLKGDLNSLSPSAKNGLEIFNGKGKCIQCHKGILNMDNSFHSIAMPQIGPGKGHGEKGFEDFGREIVTKNQSDRFKFKTPSLRNVALTGPWGHDRAYGSLRDVILHHLNPVSSLQNYSLENAYLPSRVDLDLVDGMAMKDQDYINELLNSNETSNILLSEKELDDLLNFLYSLTDPAVYELPRIIPKRVPSDLPVSD
jgi:cytochrome c peroxidase